MKNDILRYCRNELQRFYNMSDMEIYDWMCENFYTKDYEMLRECSFIIFRESR